MNRSDEIQAVARDIAQRVTCDPEQRNAMADDLIKLVSLVVAAVGKDLAVAGESGLNEALGWEFELDTESIDYSPEEFAAKEAEFEAEQREESTKCHGMYLTGERIQEGAQWVQDEACGADLERYERDGLTPVWVPQAACEGVSICSGIHNLRGEHLRDHPVPKFTGCPDEVAPQPCTWLPGDAIPSCDFNPGCSEHGQLKKDSHLCQGCGNPADVGLHGPNQGFGGCV